MSLENSFSLTPHKPLKRVDKKFYTFVRGFGVFMDYRSRIAGLAGSLSEQCNDNVFLLYYDGVAWAGDYNIGEYYKHAAIFTRFIAYPDIPDTAEILLVFKLEGPLGVITPSKIQVWVGGNLEEEDEWQGGEENVPVLFDKPLRYIDIIIRSVSKNPLLFKSVDGYII